MNIESFCLLDHCTDRKINYLSSIEDPSKDLLYYLYQMARVKQNKMATILFKPIETLGEIKFTPGEILPCEVINHVQSQLMKYLKPNSTQLCMTTLNSPFLDLYTKLRVLQSTISGNLTNFQIEELLKATEKYNSQIEAFLSSHPDSTLTFWFINQINGLAIMLNLNLLTTESICQLLRSSYISLDSFFEKKMHTMDTTYLCNWLVKGLDNVEIPLNSNPLKLLTNNLLHKEIAKNDTHPYLSAIKSEWLKSCISEDYKFSNHVKEGGSPQKYLLKKYNISRATFKHLNKINCADAFNNNAILFSILLSKLPISHWPNTLDEVEIFSYRIALVEWLPMRLKSQALLVLKNHPKIDLIQLEKILLDNESLVKMTYPYISDVELESLLISFYSRKNDIILTSRIKRTPIKNDELVEPLNFFNMTDNSISFGFTISQLRPNLYTIFSRDWQNCLDTYQSITALGLSKILLLTSIENNETYLLEISLNVDGKIIAVQIKDVQNNNPPYGMWLQVQQWLNTQDLQIDTSIIPESLISRVQVIVDNIFSNLKKTKLNLSHTKGY
ncbi:TPA: hypothetical protein ACGUP1_002888 [Vibrio vulnificus]|nr:hypothetical protein [Vibrio vulnificus]HDY7436647.1 hypothetical protein [Vibrio vulnificus]